MVVAVFHSYFNPLSANPTKWSNILKQFVGLSTNCLSVFDHFVILALKGLNYLVFLEMSVILSKKIIFIVIATLFCSQQRKTNLHS